MFDNIGSTAHVKKEKAKARELRKSRWWKQRIAQPVCHYCQQSMMSHEATMDHVVALSRGGVTSKGNVVVACKCCNNLKKDASLLEWLNYLEEKKRPL